MEPKERPKERPRLKAVEVAAVKGPTLNNGTLALVSVLKQVLAALVVLVVAVGMLMMKMMIEKALPTMPVEAS